MSIRHLKIDISTKIGNPPSPLMCCPLKNTKKSLKLANATGLLRDFVSFDLGGHTNNNFIDEKLRCLCNFLPSISKPILHTT
jgi:hypothetical protein